jgi:oxalate decarboxylase
MTLSIDRSTHAGSLLDGETVEFIITFGHERPEDFGLAGAFAAMTDAVLGNTYD